MVRGESRMTIRTYTPDAGDKQQPGKRLQVIRPHDGFPPSSVYAWPACKCPRCLPASGK